MIAEFNIVIPFWGIIAGALILTAGALIEGTAVRRGRAARYSKAYDELQRRYFDEFGRRSDEITEAARTIRALSDRLEQLGEDPDQIVVLARFRDTERNQ